MKGISAQRFSASILGGLATGAAPVRRTYPWRLGLVLLLVSLLAWRVAESFAYPTVPLPDPGPCPRRSQPQLLIKVLDDSGSMDSSDPQSRRFPELDQSVNWMARHRCHPDDRISTIHFASQFARAGPWRLSEDLDPVHDSLSGPDASIAGGGTVLAPAVVEATALATAYPEHRSTLVLASDGVVDDEEEAFQALADFGGAVHVVVLGGKLPSSWQAAPITAVHKLSPATQFGEVARALADVWTAATRAP